MQLKLPPSLHYPITVTELLKKPDDNIEKFAPLFSYSYETTVPWDDELGNEGLRTKTFPTTFESSVDGIFKSWKLEKGAVLTSKNAGQSIAEIEEPCAHSVQYGGMCVSCGKDMTETSYASVDNTSRARINMTHDNVNLKISEDQAAKIEEEAKRRLMKSKKLSLVVDLDQTIIHATVDQTIPEWQKDPNNPNHEAVKDVRAFQLLEDAPGNISYWYYIKFRPGLHEFLERVSEIYECHIYTMGTRAYAQNIAQLIDPERKIFGDRILSRDESGSMSTKKLQRLFPVDTKMVVIIDDRADVWNWNVNLVKVTPFNFFVGAGDINSSFLPKQDNFYTGAAKPNTASTPRIDEVEGDTITGAEPQAAKANGSDAPPSSNGTSDTPATSALAQIVSLSGNEDPGLLQAQMKNHEETLMHQLQDKPLLRKQLQLEAEDAASAGSSSSSSGDENSSDPDKASPASSVSSIDEPDKHRHPLLHDDDTELYYLEQGLRTVHTEFFATHARSIASAQGGRVAEIRGESGASRRKRGPAPHDVENQDLELIPDIKSVMPTVKSRVLAGCVIVFSGVVPIGKALRASDIAIWAMSFGAEVDEEVSKRRTTHLVAARNRTAKVRKAVRLDKGRGRIKVVNTQWLLDSIVRWERMDERPYLMETGVRDVGKALPGEEDGEVLSGSESMEAGPSGADTDTESTTDSDVDRKRKRPGGSGPLPATKLRLRVSTPPPPPSQIATTSSSSKADTGHQHADADADADTDVLDEDIEAILPPDDADDGEDEQRSPVGGTEDNWKSMRDELDEFLGSDLDSDTESTTSVENFMAKKRKRDGVGTGMGMGTDGEEESSGEDASPRRKKVALERGTGTGLRESRVPGDDDDLDEDEDILDGGDGVGVGLGQVGSVNGMAKKSVAVEGEDDGSDEDDKDDEDDEDDENDGEDNASTWSDFEGELEREMERAESEEKAKAAAAAAVAVSTNGDGAVAIDIAGIGDENG